MDCILYYILKAEKSLLTLLGWIFFTMPISQREGEIFFSRMRTTVPILIGFEYHSTSRELEEYSNILLSSRLYLKAIGTLEKSWDFWIFEFGKKYTRVNAIGSEASQLSTYSGDYLAKSRFDWIQL